MEQISISTDIYLVHLQIVKDSQVWLLTGGFELLETSSRLWGYLRCRQWLKLLFEGVQGGILLALTLNYELQKFGLHAGWILGILSKEGHYLNRVILCCKLNWGFLHTVCPNGRVDPAEGCNQYILCGQVTAYPLQTYNFFSQWELKKKYKKSHSINRPKKKFCTYWDHFALTICHQIIWKKFLAETMANVQKSLKENSVEADFLHGELSQVSTKNHTICHSILTSAISLIYWISTTLPMLE